MSDKAFTEAQKQYLCGFTLGSEVARSVRGLPVLTNQGAGGTSIQVGRGPSPGEKAAGPEPPEAISYAAQDRLVANGGKLSTEEKAKRDKNPLDLWDELAARATAGAFPKGTDVFLSKFHGLFYVAPAQDAYMCRLRIPGGELYAHQLDGLADLAERSAGGYLDVTTRANVQLREIPADQAMEVLYGVRELGLVSLGAGGDNIRNVTASPLSGIDPNEITETLPLAKRMHHYILNHREMYGLPRKFNIAYDGGGKISALDDTNDIGFHAVQITEPDASEHLSAGVYFQLTLGGITGHQDFARDTGILLKPEETFDVAGAIVRVFVQNGDRTDRKKARLKYLLDEWGFEKFLAEVEKVLGSTLRRVPQQLWTRPDREDRHAHVDFHPQRQPGKNYVGVVLSVGRLTCSQARGLASIASRFGSGRLRLTVWQNLLIPDIADEDCDAVRDAIVDLGLHFSATSFRAGLVACTGKQGCKFAAADTKQHALEIAQYLESQFDLDSPINIHVTGCHHSCAQHYIGDIGLIATKVEVDEEMVDGYDILVGGGWGTRQSLARPVADQVPADEVPQHVGAMISVYLQRREHEEPFAAFIDRQSDEALRELCSARAPCASSAPLAS